VKLGLLDEEGGDREGSTSRGGRHVPPGQRRGVERAATVGRTEGGYGVDTAEAAPWGRRGRGADRGGETGEGLCGGRIGVREVEFWGRFIYLRHQNNLSRPNMKLTVKNVSLSWIKW
jgi:hypothetical protein